MTTSRRADFTSWTGPAILLPPSGTRLRTAPRYTGQHQKGRRGDAIEGTRKKEHENWGHATILE